jgi:acetyl esterase/lipase
MVNGALTPSRLVIGTPVGLICPLPRQNECLNVSTETLNHTTEDIEYLRHGDRPMTLRLFRPAGTGPFPAVPDLHGGAWTEGDLNGCQARDEVLAEAGIAAAALDFRQAGDGYPTSLVDINYAVRWLKAHAAELNVDADRIGVVGQSSGGHLAMLSAMRPRDLRYAEIELDAGAQPVDASVRCVGMLWPVINPLSRYRRVRRLRDEENTPAWVGNLPERHDLYWISEQTMDEGNPMLALERGETLEMPPALWVQGRPDPVHDYRDPDSPLDLNEPERFAENYRRAGGDIEVLYIDQDVRSTNASFDPLARFLRQHLLALS